MVAHITGHRATKLVIAVGDAHIYNNQIELVKQQINRMPSLEMNTKVEFGDNIHEISDFNKDNIKVVGYDTSLCGPDIRYPVAV